MRSKKKQDSIETAALGLMTMFLSGGSGLVVYLVQLTQAYKLLAFWGAAVGAAIFAVLTARVSKQHRWLRLVLVIIGYVGPILLSSASPSLRPVTIATWVFLFVGASFSLARDFRRIHSVTRGFAIAWVIMGLLGPASFYYYFRDTRGFYYSLYYVMGLFFLVLTGIFVSGILNKSVNRNTLRNMEEDFPVAGRIVPTVSRTSRRLPKVDFDIVIPPRLPGGFEESDRRVCRHKRSLIAEIIFEDGEKNLLWVRESKVPVWNGKLGTKHKRTEERVGGVVVSIEEDKKDQYLQIAANTAPESFREANWKQGETYVNLRSYGISQEELKEVIASMIGVKG